MCVCVCVLCVCVCMYLLGGGLPSRYPFLLVEIEHLAIRPDEEKTVVERRVVKGPHGGVCKQV